MDKYEKQQEKEKQLYDKKHAEDFDSTYNYDLSSLQDNEENSQNSGYEY